MSTRPGTVHPPIGDIQIGDQVRATDPTSGQTGARTVTVLHRNQDTDLTDVTVGTTHGASGETSDTTVLRTTQHHPFWDTTVGAWALAANLVPGHELHTGDGDTVTVVSVINRDVTTGGQDMRDLTVADIHTYYVIAGTTPVPVHNCGPGDSDDLIHVYRAAQRGNGADELANGLNPARHAGGNGLAYAGTEDVAQKYADYSVGTHEDYYTKFTFKRSEFEEHFGVGLPYEGDPSVA